MNQSHTMDPFSATVSIMIVGTLTVLALTMAFLAYFGHGNDQKKVSSLLGGLGAPANGEVVINQFPPAGGMNNTVTTLAIGRALPGEFSVTEIHIAINGINNDPRGGGGLPASDSHRNALYGTGAGQRLFGLYSPGSHCHLCALPVEPTAHIAGFTFTCLRFAALDAGVPSGVGLMLSGQELKNNDTLPADNEIISGFQRFDTAGNQGPQNAVTMNTTRILADKGGYALNTQKYLYMLQQTAGAYQGEYNGYFEIKLYISHYN